jgi:hypothetical protein
MIRELDNWIKQARKYSMSETKAGKRSYLRNEQGDL